MKGIGANLLTRRGRLVLVKWFKSPYNFLFSILLAGAAILFIYTSAAYSMWYDEQWVADSIMQPTWRGMLHFTSNRVAGWGQTSPVGFLATTRVITDIFGHSDLVFRIMPVFLTLASAILIYILSIKMTKSGPAAILASSFFLFNPQILRYATELKQYVGDVLLFLLVIYLFEKYADSGLSKNYAFILAGVAAVGALFSHASVIIIPTAVILIFISNIFSFGKAGALRATAHSLAVAGAFLAVFVPLYFISIRPVIFSNEIQHFWDKFYLQGGSFPDLMTDFLKSSWIFIQYFFRFHMPVQMAWMLFVLVGIVVSVLKGRHRLLGYLLVPWFGLILAGYLKLYPYSGGRPALFMIAAICLFVGIAASSIESVVAKWRQEAGKAIVLILSVMPILIFGSDLYLVEKRYNKVEDLVRRYEKDRQAGDAFLTDEQGIYTLDRYGGQKIAGRYVEVGGLGLFRNVPFEKGLSKALEYIDGGRIWMLLNEKRRKRFDVERFMDSRCRRMGFYETNFSFLYLYDCGLPAPDTASSKEVIIKTF